MKKDLPRRSQASRSPRRAPFTLQIENGQRAVPIPRARIHHVVSAAAEQLGASGETALLLTRDPSLRRLNRTFRGKDKPTDVLAFPASRSPETDPENGALGDIAISVDTAARNARAQGRSVAVELQVLALHGFLHLLGYDHETDDGEMEALEKRLRLRLIRDRDGRGSSRR
jgi:probable rRNA maturation factor